MVHVGNVRDWRLHDVVDSEGKKIGKMEAVYVDTATDQPAFASVSLSGLGRRRIVFVPLEGAVVSPQHLMVTYPKKQVKDSPAIDVDGELAAETEPALFDHYGLDYHAGLSGERRLARR